MQRLWMATAAVVCVAATCYGWSKAPKVPPVKVQLKTSSGEAAGSAVLTQKGDGVDMRVKVNYIPAGLHGIHIHEHGMCDAPDFKTAGGHFNPTGKKHGFQSMDGHHAGDTEKNLAVDMSHSAMQDFFFKGVTLDPQGGANSLTANGGTAIVIHENADDMHTDPSGNSGNRIACGVIAVPASN